MNTRIVSNGRSRLHRDKEFQAGVQARLQELRATIEARHAAELAKAGFFGRLLVRWRIAAEFRRERCKVVPSRESLYSKAKS